MDTTKTLPLRYFLRYFKKYSLGVAAAFVFLILAKVGATLEPLYLKRIIDALTSRSAAEALQQILILYFGIKLLSIFFEFLRDYIFSPVVMGVSRDIEVSVFDHLLKLPVSYHADQKSGAAARAIARGSRAITFVLDFSVSQILPPVFELAFVTFLLLRLYSWEFATITLGTVILYGWFTIWSTDKRQKYRIEGNVKDDQSSGILVDAVTNMDTVKYFNSERKQFSLFTKIKDEWFHLMVRNNRLFSLIYGVQGLILTSGLGWILILAVQRVTSGTMTVGDLVLVTVYIARLSGPITTLGFVYGQFKNSFADLDAMGQILSQEVTIPEPAHPKALKDPQGTIQFDNVSFGYIGREAVINNLNLEVKSGQKVAFVGSSGAGKSTIAKLLFRLYDVKEGAIVIDGVDLRDLSSETRRKVFGIVPQEPALFNDTIANNIKFGKPEATHEEVVAAAKAAQIHTFIESLPEGYNTLVG
ncbi:MAG TPA: ABC transporter ATP-binding protein, partial [Patescibacteria group bacterium]